MAIRIECDGGCGALAESQDEFVRFGSFKPGYYCQECHKSVATYYAARDSLHGKVADKWRSGLAGLDKKWLAEHPNGVLPDGT